VEEEHKRELVLVPTHHLLMVERTVLLQHNKYENATKIHAQVVYCDTF
jgi:hypothetical protein